MKVKKTYIVAAVVAIVTFLKEVGIEIPSWIGPILVAAGAAALRAAISKVEPK